MKEVKRKVFCNMLYELFVECCVEDADTVRIKMELPEFKKQLTAIIKFDMVNMGVIE